MWRYFHPSLRLGDFSLVSLVVDYGEAVIASRSAGAELALKDAEVHVNNEEIGDI